MVGRISAVVMPTHRLGIGAGAIIFDDARRVLLVRQSYGRRCYTLPGGEVEVGEPPHEAAIREAAEEAGVMVVVKHLVSVYWQTRANLDYLYALFGFRCEIVGEATPRIIDRDEICEIGWFDPSNLPDPFTEGTSLLIADAVADRRGFVGVAAI
jgi:ADP-ribose pyrophosphatase YjhB (NUDIX family)